MTTRARLTRAQKVRIFDRARGICHICGHKIHVAQPWEAEHIIPLWAGGEDTPENMAPAHIEPCHSEKSADEAASRARETRIRANHLGIEKPGPKLPGGKKSGIRKKINGAVVPRLERGEAHRRVMAEFPNRRGE